MQDLRSQILEKLAFQTSGWSTMRVRTTAKCEFYDKATSEDPTSYRQIVHERAVSSTQSVFDDFSMELIGGWTRRYVGLDGPYERTRIDFTKTDPNRQRNYVITKPGPASKDVGTVCWEWPQPFDLLHDAGVPLHERLKTASHLGRAVVGKWQCEKFERTVTIRPKQEQDLVWYLEVNSGIPVRHERFHRELGDRTLVNDWQAERLETQLGFVYPVESRDLGYFRDPKTKEWKPLNRVDIKVDSIFYNAQLPASLFKPPSPQPGIVVSDAIRKTKRVVFPLAKKGETSDAGQTTQATASPMRAIPPTHWSSTVSTAGLLLGGAALIAGGGLLIRRRWGQRG